MNGGNFMEKSAKHRLDNFMNGFARRNPGQSEFHQAVYEVAVDIIPFIQENPVYEEHKILERLTEPDQIVVFRVNWEDDNGNFRANRGYRVQHSNAIGPYKGGIRFHRDLTLDTLKFLAFEQTLKNSLTGLPMGLLLPISCYRWEWRAQGIVMRECYTQI
jgi:glutamate dehydrogenase (NADP+)